jgi:hypothetical protein
MRNIKAIIYAMLGGMVAYGYWQRGQVALAGFIAIFTIAIMALTLSPIGRMKIRWDADGITLSVFPKKPQHIPWGELESISLDHLGYHVKSARGRFKIRKKSMPENLLKRIKENVRKNRA